MTKRHIFPNDQKLAQAVAEHICHLAKEAISERGRFMIALSGGSMPRLLGSVLADEPWCSQVDWSNSHVFFADERCVPLTAEESNYHLARAELLDKVPIPASQIHPIEPVLDPAEIAVAYQKNLARVFQPKNGRPPIFDLILLGMGPDGHTASLFPQHPLLNENTLWVAPILDSPKPPPQRVTLTYPVINHARVVAFIVTGSNKAEAVASVFTDDDDSLPAARVALKNGTLHWYLDEAAAAQLD